MAAFQHRRLYHCGFVGDTAAGNGDLSLLLPEPVTGFPTDRQVAQLVGGGWGRCCAVGTGNPPCLISWGLGNNLPNPGAGPEPPYVRCELLDVAFVALGWQHTLIMRQDGSVQHRGWVHTPLSTSANLPDTKSAQASSSSTGSSRHGEEVTTDVDLSEQPVMLAAGEAHSLALTASGEVYGWGSNSNGQVGTGKKEQHCQVELVQIASVIQRLLGSSLHSRVTQVACGARHSVAVTSEGIVLCWGWGLHGQCGNGTMAESVLVPTPVTALLGQSASQVAAGLGHTMCCMLDGSTYAWGWGCNGQLGSGDTQSSLEPILVDAAVLEQLDVVKVSAGARHSLLLTKCGRVFTCGQGQFGQLGLGDIIERLSPVEVHVPGNRVVDAICGWWHTLFLSVL